MARRGRHPGRAGSDRLGGFAETPELRRVVETHFPGLWDRFSTGPGGAGASRREFLKLMGASLALAGLTGCRWPKETIVPATRQSVDRLPGVPVQYATAIELGGVATGLLVTSYDGRPIKIEGNDKHPFSRGKTNHWMQASILDLYDPDRSQRVIERVGGSGGVTHLTRTWEEFDAFARQHFAELRERQGEGLCVLVEASFSPSLMEMRSRFQREFRHAGWIEFESLPRVEERNGAQMAFDRLYRAQLDLTKADVIVSLDDDLLMTHPAALRYEADFAARRRADDGSMSRLYVIESNLTVTGAAADHRYAIRNTDVGVAAGMLAQALIAGGLSWPGSAADVRAALDTFAAPHLDAAFVTRLAADLLAHRGRSIVTVGPRQPAAVHLIAHVLNEALGNVGATIFHNDGAAPLNGHIAWAGVLEEMVLRRGAQTLLILGGNPAAAAPPDAAVADHISNVRTAIYLGPYVDETAQLCAWHVPQAHYLESWGDARAYDGTVSIIQPLIEPLYAGRTPVELLALVLGDENPNGYELVHRTFRE